jgi:hypothetical protein
MHESCRMMKPYVHVSKDSHSVFKSNLLDTDRKVQMPVSENEIRLGQKGDTFLLKKSSK